MSPDQLRCPVSHTDYRHDGPILSHYAMASAEREAEPFYLNDATSHPFWMLTRYEHVLEAIQMPEYFSNSVSNALSPDRKVRFMPNNLDGEEHLRLRRVLNRWFSPAAVRSLDGLAKQRARDLIGEIAPLGRTDLVDGFALRYPTEMFLATIGMPVEDGPKFLDWVGALFSNLYKGPEAEAAVASIRQYFDDAIEDRRRSPRDPETDFLSRMLHPDHGPQWLDQEDLKTVCLSLVTAGLDTTRSGLGYVFAHLATHPEDRQALVDDPELIPKAIEEFMRLYSLILQEGRLVLKDIDFHGLPMKAGDIVWLGIASANRDPRKFECPEEFRLDRANTGHHLGFGAGPHRCLGMHLARHELEVVVREWHRQIPQYGLAPGTELIERGHQLSLRSLPLAWPAQQ
ncbi:cytochrome P450 [Dactylosporangium sucinum]|uniref:Cytochrome P450 n=1 Tax=Dactylosporangium sucinum TaxID=1424081 RepID=A0A917TEN3_9ACTN|nr:cytochrome P450 [Dactylosporangium sucinum]GGM20745.1 cytochrome P450 [Dactylosporangium sucinum]